jgi:CDP-paratose synthetase
MKKIVITGATGFLGRHLFKYLKANSSESEVYAILRQSSDISLLPGQIVPIVCDNSFDSLNKVFFEHKFDTLIHLATRYVFDHSPNDINELIESNIKFGFNLLEAASLNGCLKFLNAGSYTQNYFSDDFYPSSLYSVTKQAMENAVSYYSMNRNLSAITLKLYDVYGNGDNRKKIINLFKESQEKDLKLKMSPGEQEIRLTYIDDVLEAIKVSIKMLETFTNKHRIYYVGAESYKLKEVARIFEKTSKKPLNIEWGAFPYREGQPMKSYIGNLLPGWESKIDLKDGIEKFLNQ